MNFLPPSSSPIQHLTPPIFTDTTSTFSHWLRYLIYANLFHNTHIFRIWWYFHWVARWMIKSHERVKIVNEKSKKLQLICK
jgi:hypothetical protein